MNTPLAVRIVLCACVFVASDAVVLAQSVSLNPVADAFVSSSEPASNYGGGGALGVSALVVPNGELQSLLRFDLSSAKSSFDSAHGPGNWLLSSVTLQLAASSPSNSIFNAPNAGQFSATWMQDDSWVEGTGTPSSPGSTGVTWNTLPSYFSLLDQSVGIFNFDGSTTATAIYSLTLSSGLVGDATAGDLASILLRAPIGETAMAGVFNSRSFGTTSRRPLLTLNAVAVPEPGTWLLAACGAAFSARAHRRTKQQSDNQQGQRRRLGYSRHVH
jgi:hypothetical protein